jgi:predicted esterase
VFLGHGTADKKVPIRYGKQSATLLEELDVRVTWREYVGLGHWRSDDMLGDVVKFLGDEMYQ